MIVPVPFVGVMQTSIRLCPKCGGQKHVAKPPWVPGDQHEWSSASTGSYTCPLCNGEGIIAVSVRP